MSKLGVWRVIYSHVDPFLSALDNKSTVVILRLQPAGPLGKRISKLPSHDHNCVKIMRFLFHTLISNTIASPCYLGCHTASE